LFRIRRRLKRQIAPDTARERIFGSQAQLTDYKAELFDRMLRCDVKQMVGTWIFLTETAVTGQKYAAVTIAERDKFMRAQPAIPEHVIAGEPQVAPESDDHVVSSEPGW